MVRGEGVAKDVRLAYMWLELAAAQGDENASKWRDVVASFMTSEQIAEAEKMAEDMAKKNRRKQQKP